MCHLVWEKRCQGSSWVASHFRLLLHSRAWSQETRQSSVKELKLQKFRLQQYKHEAGWESPFSLGKLTSRFDLGEEGSQLFALHNVGDDMARHLRVGSICDDHWGATLQSPQRSLDLQTNTDSMWKISIKI